MADNTSSALPPLDSPSETPQQESVQVQVPIGGDDLIGPTTKDTMIGIGALVILTIIFFFIRLAFINYLVGPSMKRSPNNAGMAGWCLFAGLFFGGAIGCVALISKTYLTMPLIIPLSILSLICFVMAFVVASKK